MKIFKLLNDINASIDCIRPVQSGTDWIQRPDSININAFSGFLFCSSVRLAWQVALIFSINLFLMVGCVAPRKTLDDNGAGTYTSYEIMQMQRKMDGLVNTLGEIEMRVKANEEALARIAGDMKDTEASSVNITSTAAETLEKSAVFTSSQSAEILYRKGRAHLMENQYESAEKLFRQLAQQYPDHRLAVNALYWMGECHYAMQDYHGAIMIFKKLLKEYPEGTKAPDALLKTAYAYLSLDETEKAHQYLKLVVKQFPFSTAGEQAEEKLKLFQ